MDDDFNRSENPLSNGGKWVKVTGASSAGQCNVGASNGYAAATAYVSGEDGAYWSPVAFDSSVGPVYALARVTKVAGTSLRQTGLWVCRPEGEPQTNSGYYLRAEKIAGANNIKWTLEKWTTGTPEVLKTLETTEFVVGAEVALVVGEGKVMFFARASAESEFTEKLSAEDGAYTKGYSGVRAKGLQEFYVRDFRTGVLAEEEEEEPPPEGGTVKLMAGAGLVDATRWVKVGGILVPG